MSLRKQIISEAVLNELKGLGAFITPDYIAREALVKGWSDPKIDMGFGYSTGYTPQKVMGDFAEHGSIPSKFDRVSAYMVANARNTAKLRKQTSIQGRINKTPEQKRIQHKLDRRYRGLVRVLKRLRAVDPGTNVNLTNVSDVAQRMYRDRYPTET